jgi:hypothetical protein
MSAAFNERGPFRVGEVCIIVKTISFPELMGREVTIISPPTRGVIANTGEEVVGYLVDLVHRGRRIGVPEDCLRRRRPPATGEQMIRAMFDVSAAERRKPAPAWQAPYDTAQALMKMGARVKSGRLAVEVVA